MIKDTILRVKLEQGHRVELCPGWDCHGLPIELKAISSLGGEKPADPMQLRSVCRRHAHEAIQAQKDDMMRWGLLADYARPILTMDPGYEAAQLHLFAKFVERNLVFQDTRPVYWSPSSQTALAEAELEYREDHCSTACFVKLPLWGRPQTSLLIWTTTPWTLPANQAVGINPTLEYVSVRLGSRDDGAVIVAAACLPKLLPLIASPGWQDQRPISVAELVALKYINPWYPDVGNPVVAADFVTAETGTGLVHLAPAHGRDDFAACRDVGIGARLIVSGEGRYDGAMAPASLQGRDVLGDGAERVIAELRAQDLLLATHEYTHRYPYDWRTRKPVIQRATPQWFIKTEPILAQLREALKEVTFIPESGRRRLESMASSRTEWCISRQRSWGVPIPAFYHLDSGRAVLDGEIVQFVADRVRAAGSDVWWTASVSDLLPPSMRHLADRLRKGGDTFDVWFDSGSFWMSAAAPGDAPADLYIEGTDQYRGWFQSSLITSGRHGPALLIAANRVNGSRCQRQGPL